MIIHPFPEISPEIFHRVTRLQACKADQYAGQWAHPGQMWKMMATKPIINIDPGKPAAEVSQT